MYRLLPALALTACGTMHAARPLPPGEQQIGVNLGGPFTTSLGPPIPIPNLVIEGRTGLKPLGDRPVDINYGVNLTTLAFGTLGMHGGGSIHLIEQRAGGYSPAISITERIHLYDNHLDWTKQRATRATWVANELDLTMSWAIKVDHLIYLGVTDALDFADPELLIGPFIGTELRPGGGSFAWQVESRWVGANFSPEVYDVDWLNTGDPGHGLFTFTIGAAWTLGKETGS